MPDHVGFDFAAVQQMTAATDQGLNEQNATRTTYGQLQSELVGSGLAGTVQSAAVASNQAGHDDWHRQVMPRGQRLVDNNYQAIRVNADGQDNAHGVMSQSSYGGHGVANIITPV